MVTISFCVTCHLCSQNWYNSTVWYDPWVLRDFRGGWDLLDILDLLWLSPLPAFLSTFSEGFWVESLRVQLMYKSRHFSLKNLPWKPELTCPCDFPEGTLQGPADLATMAEPRPDWPGLLGIGLHGAKHTGALSDKHCCRIKPKTKPYLKGLQTSTSLPDLLCAEFSCLYEGLFSYMSPHVHVAVALVLMLVCHLSEKIKLKLLNFYTERAYSGILIGCLYQ